MCRHWVHKKCIGDFKNSIDFKEFISSFANKDWECPECISQYLPFVKLDEYEFQAMLLEMSSSISCTSTEDFLRIYHRLETLQLMENTDPDKDFKFDKINRQL